MVRSEGMSQNTRAGFFWSLTSAVLWSTTFIGGRYPLGRRRVDPITLSAMSCNT